MSAVPTFSFVAAHIGDVDLIRDICEQFGDHTPTWIELSIVVDDSMPYASYTRKGYIRDGCASYLGVENPRDNKA